MAHFAIAHVMRLRDGLYAVRSAEFPGCEGRDVAVWPARAQFREALSGHVGAMIRDGEMPALFPSLEEAEAVLGEHCKVQIEAPDRLPKTFDYTVIVEVELAPDDAERFAALRIGKLLPESQL
jgi:hypothetical protein